MRRISSRHLIIAGCIACVLLTLIAKSYVHEIINPQWYSSALGSSLNQTTNGSITLHYHERRPFYLSYKNEVHGLVADQISLAFQYADIPYIWRETPAARQLDIIQKDQDKSCAVGWFKTKEREQFAQFSSPVYRDKPFLAITRADNSILNETENLEQVLGDRRLQLLVKSGYSYGEYIDTRINSLKPRILSTTVDNQNMLKMIQAHRAAYCFMTEEEAHDLLLFSGLKRTDFKVVYFKDIPEGNKRYIICSKQVRETTIKDLNSAIQHLLNIEDNDV